MSQTEGYKDREGSGAHCAQEATGIMREMCLFSLEKRSMMVAVYKYVMRIYSEDVDTFSYVHNKRMRGKRR